MPKCGFIAHFTKILDRGGKFTPPPNKLTSIIKPNKNRVKTLPDAPKLSILPYSPKIYSKTLPNTSKL